MSQENIKAIVLSFNIRDKWAHPSLKMLRGVTSALYNNMGNDFATEEPEDTFLIGSYKNEPSSTFTRETHNEISNIDYKGVSKDEAKDIVRYLVKRLTIACGKHLKPYGKKWYLDIELHSELPEDFDLPDQIMKPYQLEKNPESLNMKLKFIIPLTTPKIEKFYEGYLKLDVAPIHDNFVVKVKPATPYYFDETKYYEGKTFKKQSELKTICPDIEF